MARRRMHAVSMPKSVDDTLYARHLENMASIRERLPFVGKGRKRFHNTDLRESRQVRAAQKRAWKKGGE